MPDNDDQIVHSGDFGDEHNWHIRDVYLDEASPTYNPGPWWKRGVPIIMMIVSIFGTIVVAMGIQIARDIHLF